MSHRTTHPPFPIQTAPMGSLSSSPYPWLMLSALFHYLGPAFAVLLFPHVGVLGIAWFRIATAAGIFALWSRPWRTFRRAGVRERQLILALGVCLAMMNTSFYLAIDRLPLGLVATLEFAAVIAVAAYGLRTQRNTLALALASLGALQLTHASWAKDSLGLCFALLNALLFAAYLVLGHRLAQEGATNGIHRLAASMGIAFLLILPVGLGEATAALASPTLVLAGIGVGICSSVIPYICDQVVMARLPRPTFALYLSILPAIAVLLGALVLGQIPTLRDLLGIALVMAGLGLHRPDNPSPPPNAALPSAVD